MANDPKPAPDLPSQRPAALESLNALVGTWSIEFVHVALPEPVHGRNIFEWLKGERFLIQRSYTDNSDVPEMIAIIGTDETGDEFIQHYYDSRGVQRTYKMSLCDGIWKLWRDAPGFSQRSTGTISADGNTIKVVGELARDDGHWAHDFEQTYTKLR